MTIRPSAGLNARPDPVGQTQLEIFAIRGMRENRPASRQTAIERIILVLNSGGYRRCNSLQRLRIGIPDLALSSRAAMRLRYVITCGHGRVRVAHNAMRTGITRSALVAAGKSRSMSGHSPRSSERNRSNNNSMPIGSTA